MYTSTFNVRDYESVSSIINPSISIQYHERVRDRIDENHRAYIRNVTIYGKPFKIIIGKTNFRVSINQKFSSIVYFNIYRVEGQEVKEKIGIFETKPTELSNLIGTLDITNNIYDIDISKFRQPIFFKSFINKYFPEKQYDQLKENRFRETPLAQQVRKRKNPMRLEGAESLPSTQMDTDRTNMDTGRTNMETGRTNMDTGRASDASSMLDTNRGITERVIDRSLVEQGIQTSLTNTSNEDDEKALLADEDEMNNTDTTLQASMTSVDNLDEIQEQQIKRYVDSVDDNWIQRKFKNKGFELVTEDVNGTTLFDVLESVFNNENIREMFSESITQDHFSRYMKVYTNLKNGIEGIQNKQRQLAVDIKAMKGKDDETKQKRKQLRVMLKNTKKKIDEKREMLSKYAFMEKINNDKDLKEFAKTPDFWGDGLAITILETVLYKEKAKLIVLLEDRNDQHKLNNVISCNNYNRIDVDSYRAIKPNKYVILSLKGTEYTLVKFNGQTRHKFSELPYILKRKMIDNCTNIA
tara:strand:+ start:2287 stop:3861 length:1575 start_codon:yes stop_codon:yes gene_type:complete